MEFVKVGKPYNSNHGGKWFHIYFRDTLNKKSYRTALYENMRNFKNWSEILKKAKRGDLIDNLNLKQWNGKEIVDADSFPKLITQEQMIELEDLAFEEFYGVPRWCKEVINLKNKKWKENN